MKIVQKYWEIMCGVWNGHANTRANKGEARASLSNHHGHTCEHVLTRGHTHVHARTFLPCVSVDWVNQPNFPLFFSVRSARVTPWRYQHAVHTARQQRQQWTSTKQRGGGEREKEREREEESMESCSTNYSTNTATAPRKASKKRKILC